MSKFFDDDGDVLSPRASTRRGDPEVSFDAAKKLSQVSVKQKIILRRIRAHERSLITMWHIEDELPNLGGHQKSTVRTRIAELCGIGAVGSTTRVWPPKVIKLNRQMVIEGRRRDCIRAACYATDDEFNWWVERAMEENAERRK